MITTVKIENLRGIASGALDGLAPLTILTGPNGAGKSTVIDALAIGACHGAVDGVRYAVVRRPGTRDGAQWLIRTGTPGPFDFMKSATIAVGNDVKREVSVVYGAASAELTQVLRQRTSPEPYGMFTALLRGTDPAHKLIGSAAFASDNTYAIERVDLTRSPFGPVWFVTLETGALADVFSEATADGNARTRIHSQLAGALRDLVPDFSALELYTSSGRPGLRIARTSGSAVPIGMLGDGVHALIAMSLQLDARETGTFLIEEPETHQHPRAMVWITRVIAQTISRGCQVVLTTHSLEFIDLLREAMADQLDKVAVFNLALRDGVLHHARHAGADLEFAREKLGMELR